MIKNFLYRIATALVYNDTAVHSTEELSRYAKAKEVRLIRVTLWHLAKDFSMIIVGVLSAGFGLKGFLLPNHFIDGGVTGISLLISSITGYDLAWLIVVVNIPFIILGYKQVGRIFAIKTIIAIVMLSLAIGFINYPVITSDKLLIATFGGFFLGAGIGLAVRGGSVIDGTEILGIYISRNSSITIGDVVLAINVLIFSAAAYFISIEIALYAILTYLCASKTIDFIVDGVEEYTGVTIVSLHSDEISRVIHEQMRRGVTIYNGHRGFGTHGEKEISSNIVYTVITKLEIPRLTTEIDKIDPNAFVVMNSVRGISGGRVKRRRFKSAMKKR